MKYYFTLLFYALTLKAFLCAQVYTPFKQAARDYSNALHSFSALDLDVSVLEQLYFDNPAQCLVRVPVGKSQFLDLMLNQKQVLSPQFQLQTDRGPLPYVPGHYYRGSVVGQAGSSVALSVFRDQIMGIIITESGTYNLGYVNRNGGLPTQEYVLYAEHQLKATMSFHCSTDDLPEHKSETLQPPSVDKSTAVVDVYFTADYDLYLKRGSSTTQVTNYLTGLFNQVIALYDSIGVKTQISELFVYTYTDPYVNLTTANQILSLYKTNTGLNFNGDLAHFVSTRNIGGGVAWLSGLCNSNSFAVSGIYTTYNNIPTYSWSVNVVAHEMGHNLSSRHTHSCTWGSTFGKIDNCGDVAGYSEGDCPVIGSPNDAGTQMSYCHLTGVGIQMSKHFGKLPGQKILTYVQNASCLQTNPLNCSNPIPLTCGTSYNGTTVNANNLVTTYNCTGALQLTGNERVHSFTLSQPTEVTVTLSNAHASMRILLLGSCAVNSCIEHGSTSISKMLNPGTYFIIVDALNNYAGTYKLNLQCQDQTGQYCSTSSSTQYEFIQSVSFNNYTSVTGNNNGYLFANNNPVWNLPIGGTVNFTVNFGYTGSAQKEYIRIWIDLNADKDFNDADELVYVSTFNAHHAISGNFSIPYSAQVLSAPTRIRIKMFFNPEPNGPCGNFMFGETEDYLVNFNQAQVCGVPIGLGAVVTAAHQVNLFWSKPAQSSPQSYHYQFKQSNSNSWQSAYLTSNFRQLSNLDPSKTYNFRVRSICGVGDTSAWSNIHTFSIGSLPACGTQVGLSAVALSATSVRVMMQAKTGATRYAVRYRPIGSSTWVTATRQSPILILNNLSPGTTYEYQGRVSCNGTWGQFSTSGTVTTWPPAFIEPSIPESPDILAELTLAPNPVATTLRVLYNADQPIQVEIITTTGQVVRQKTTLYADETLHVGDLPPALYLVRISSSAGHVRVMRFTKI